MSDLALKARDVNVSSKLDSLRVRTPTIDGVVLVDFQAATVLGTSSLSGRPQEVLDALCRVAKAVFDGSDHGAQQAVLMTLEEVLVLQLMPDEPGKALCFFFAPETPHGTAGKAARQATEALEL